MSYIQKYSNRHPLVCFDKADYYKCKDVDPELSRLRKIEAFADNMRNVIIGRCSASQRIEAAYAYDAAKSNAEQTANTPAKEKST